MSKGIGNTMLKSRREKEARSRALWVIVKTLALVLSRTAILRREVSFNIHVD